MRPLLILLLVASVLAGLYFLLASGDESRLDPSDTGLSAAPVDAPTEPVSSDTRAPADLLPSDGEVVSAADDSLSRVAQVGAVAGDWENSVSGRVTDHRGNPVADSPVHLERVKQGQGLLSILGAKKGPVEARYLGNTDADGNFHFAGVEPGPNYHLRAMHDSYSAVANGPLDVKETGDTRANLTFAWGPSVEGFVRDSFGQAIANAQLQLQAGLILPGIETPIDGRKAKTNTTGFFRFENVATGNNSLAVRAEGFGSLTKTINVDPNNKVPVIQTVIELNEGIGIAGRVVDPAGVGVPGARVSAYMYGTTGTTSRGLGMTSKDGSFELLDLAAGRFAIVVNARGWGEQRVPGIVAGSTDVEIQLAPLATLVGNVIPSDKSVRVNRFRAVVRTVTKEGIVAGKVTEAEFRGTPNGEFEFLGLQPGEYAVHVYAEGCAPKLSRVVQISEGETSESIRVVVGRGSSITGVVLKGNGEPLAGAVVRTNENRWRDSEITRMLAVNAPENATRRRMQTGADGKFNLDLLEPGPYQIEITHPEYTSVVRNDVIVAAGAATALGQIRLSRGGLLHGTVYDAAGMALASGKVVAIDANDAAVSFTATCDSSGKFSIPNIPSGVYRVQGYGKPGHGGSPFDIIIQGRESEVEVAVTDGGTHLQNLYLQQ